MGPRRGLYLESELHAAVGRILEDKERGITVSQTTGIPYRTLMQRVREKKRGVIVEKKKRGSKPSLAYQYEQELLAWMMEMQNAGNPASRKDIIERANALIKQLNPGATLGEGWYRRFIHRHPSLEVQTPGGTLEPITPRMESGDNYGTIVIRGYKKRAPKSFGKSDDGNASLSNDESEEFRRREMEHRWEMERERLAIEKQTNERLEKEFQLNQRLLAAKVFEAELKVKVAKAKAKAELESAGVSPAEIESLLQ